METIARILILLLLVALLVNYMRAGHQGVTAWLKAKFIGA